ncbi:MAG: ABC transporter substrate-binding protein [Planctomycetota bacterium]|jgi:branched-chain amino acid transport system substrate-binding protein|nr:ABC transporter substrate-binding protein [Planctomycetota bacterium]
MSAKILALPLAIWMLSANPPAAADPGKFSGDILIGATLPMTGDFWHYGQSAYYGVVTRIRLLNEGGGVNGKRLVLEWRDNQSDSGKAIRDVEELGEKHRVSAIIGPLFSDSVIAINPAIERLGIPLVTPLGAVDDIAVRFDWVFRVSSGNSAQARAMVQFQMEKYGARTCGIIYDQKHAFSIELARLFGGIFTARGGKVLGAVGFAGLDDRPDYATSLRLIADKKPDFIFAACYANEAVELIHASKGLGVDIRFAGPEVWDNELLFIGAGTKLAGTALVSCLYEASLRYRPFQTFMEQIRQAGMDEPDAQAASAYDAVSLLAAAMTAAKNESPKDVHRALLGIRNLNLATGRTSIDANHNAVKPVLIRVVERREDRLIPVYAERYDP